VKRQTVFLWTGGHPEGAKGCEGLADTLPDFPRPAPLRRSALIEYHWGEMKFEIVAAACSVRTTAWGAGQVTWLHCKARQTTATEPDEFVGLMTVLFPAAYVTRIQPGPTFRLGVSRKSEDDIGVFPPNQPAPVGALPLSEVERVLTELLAPERN
jgi:hypothetical protein